MPWRSTRSRSPWARPRSTPLWDLLTAQAAQPQAALAVAMVAGAVAFAPVAALTWEA